MDTNEMALRLESLTERVLRLERSNAQLFEVIGKTLTGLGQLTKATDELATITDGLVNRTMLLDAQYMGGVQ